MEGVAGAQGTPATGRHEGSSERVVCEDRVGTRYELARGMGMKWEGMK